MAGLPLVGDQFAGYRVRSVLGRGGMSVVYQAENLRLSSVIALKVLAPELATDDVFRARFLEESRIAASLNHPNVIPIFDMGSQDGLLYIAMRYVSGTDMRQMLKKRGRILPATALFLAGQAARALDAAHRRGLVHRDVKPGNLLIERGGDEADPDHVYLADFGITKHAMSRSGLTSTGQFLGTIDYVAPEQIRGTQVTGQADQYSLGCVLYECLTGRVPFEKDLDAAIIWAHVEETPVMPTVLRPELAPGIDQVFAKALAKRPYERYGSCREFVDAARVALGILGPGMESSMSLGAMTGGPQAPPVSQGRPPTERFSWSSLASQEHQVAAAYPVVPGSAAAAAASGPEPSVGQAGGALGSHRREYGAGGPDEPGQPAAAQPPPGRRRAPRWYRQPRWLALLTVLVLAIAGLGIWAGLSGSSSHNGNMAMASHSAKPKKAAPSALMQAIAVTNQSSSTKGMLPPSTCHQQGSDRVTCSNPVVGITEVAFETFPSLNAMYNAYLARVTQLNSGQFKENFNDCESEVTYGEVAWNHLYQHPKTYTVDQMAMGGFPDDKAAGRVFCNYTGGYEYMVWTNDDGRFLAEVAGPVHQDVWNWWLPIHHNLVLAGSPMNMNPSPSPSPSMTGTPSSTSSMAPSPHSSMSSVSPSPHSSSSMSG